MSDNQYRAIAPCIPDYLNGQTFVASYRPGGGGAIGSNEVAQARPDGYTILKGMYSSQCVLPATQGRSKGPDDLEAICRMSETISVYWVKSDAPWKTFTEMIAWAKANSDQLVSGFVGAWSGGEFAWRWLEMKAGFTARKVAMGGTEIVAALLGGHIQVARIGTAQSLPHYRAGKLRPMVVSGDVRRKDMPDVPTLIELGYDMKGLASGWYGYFAPKKTPRPIIDKMAEAFKKITQDERAIKGMVPLGIDFYYLGPDEFTKKWREQYLLYKDLYKKLKK